MRRVFNFLPIIFLLILLVSFFTLTNQTISVSPGWRKVGEFSGFGSAIGFVLSLLYLLVLWFINLSKKTGSAKTDKPGFPPGLVVKGYLEKTEEKKKWQPVNIILGLLVIGCVLYFSSSAPPFIAVIKLVPALILILTKRNNIFAFAVLLIFGLIIFVLPTFDASLLLASAMYMFFSILLRAFKVKRHVAIGLAIAAIFGLWMFNVLVLEKMQTFVPESSLVLVRGLDSRSSIVLSSNENEAGITATFNPGQPVFPIEKGLQKNTKYACRIVDKTGEAVIPLDKWPVFKLKGGGDFTQSGVFNDGNHLPLHIGNYTIQLVELKEGQGVIVAESDFSIVPYDKQTLSEFVAYLTSGDDSKKYYDSYTVKTDKFSISAWVQAPKGKMVGGTVKFYKTNYDGVVEETSWDGEWGFKTSSDGEPTSMWNMSGRIPPGIYHFQIKAGDTVVADLKLII